MVTYARVPCPECGKMVAENWLVRHLKAEHPIPPPDYSDIDAECQSLVAAMNAFSGIRTVESCCGHGERPFRIWFVVDDLSDLPPLLYWTDVCHTRCGGWCVTVETDCGMSPVVFKLEGPVGAFGDAETMARLMQEYLAE